MSLWTRGITSPGWVGVDLDGTLARYVSGQWPVIGEPIKPMVDLVRRLLKDGREVRIMTARVGGMFKLNATERERDDAAVQHNAVTEWCLVHLGTTLAVTAVKDYDMAVLLDDRAVTVEENTGRILTNGGDVLI